MSGVVQPWHILTLALCVLVVAGLVGVAVFAAVKLARRKPSGDKPLDRQQPQ